MFRTLNAMSPFLTCFPYHRSPSACLEGTHGDRVAGDNTQHSHRLLSFSFYATRSRTKRIQTRPLTCTFRQARRSLSRRRCGSCSVFEVAHTVYKHAMNECPFGCGCPTRVIPRERSDRGNLAARRTSNRHIQCNFTPKRNSFPQSFQSSLRFRD